MKQLLPTLLLLGCGLASNAQFLSAPDTLLVQHFTVDPSDLMLDFPSGFDLQWVNWDADNLPALCEPQTPRNWYWENDLGDPTDPPVNFAFTSCSYLPNGQPNENWLITPPVYIAHTSAELSWRSSPFEGPGYLDGYKVLVSTTGNEPFLGVFTDTLFVAAEMLDLLNGNSLNPDDYVFSPGYVHANRYTNTDYFFLAQPFPNIWVYRGRLEPHTVSLAKYVGQTIYIAFLHDSADDNTLQIDDIAVVQDQGIGTTAPILPQLHLQVRPNPVADVALFTWQNAAAQSGLLVVSDLLGRTVLEHAVERLSTGQTQVPFGSLPAGTYSCTLRTPEGQQTVLVVKK